MGLTAKEVQEQIAGVMNRYTGALGRVAGAYAASRNRERDVYWLALQTAKEHGAMLSYSRKFLQRARDLDTLENIRKANQDCLEEAEHYYGYRQILDWYLEGKPCEVPEMWGYGDFADTFGPGPGMKESLWPEHYRYVALAQRQVQEAQSDWVRSVVYNNREGAAVAFHYVMNRLPAADEFMKRVTAHERLVAEDELHHGPEQIQELARTVEFEKDLEEALQKVTELRVQELRQRNEQFLHPLNSAELTELEQDFRQGRMDSIPLFSGSVTV